MNEFEQKNRGKTALITGASSGIGYELSKIFARENYNLVLVARNLEKLNELSKELKTKNGIAIKNIRADLSLPASALEIYNQVRSESININVLVNNSGFGLYGSFAKTNLATETNMIQVNVTALVQLSKLFLIDMVKRGEGKILNVASTAAFQPGPFMSIYFATKAFVLHFSEAIAAELEGSGVTVSVLCPGPTKTNFSKIAGSDHARMFKISMDAQTVAEVGYKGLMKGKRIIIPGLQNKITAQSSRFGSRYLVTKVAKILIGPGAKNN